MGDANEDEPATGDKQQSNLFAESPVVAGWPDNAVRPAPGLKEKVAAAARIGDAGDAAEEKAFGR
ncbi:hypothetical protein ACWCOV_14305 [Kribbella sp. NPDC002412]